MSEIKRVTLTSIGPKKTKTIEKETKCIRLKLTLAEPNMKWCPVFDYEALIKNEKEKVQAEKHKEPPINGTSAPLNVGDDDKDIKRMAKHFEEKYGTGPSDRRYTYAELGAGYDESDSFIDNTEICEEELIDEGFKKYEGYYINKEKFDNSGSSERRSSDDTDGRQKRKRKSRILKSETESDSESESSVKKAKEANVKSVNTAIDSVVNGNKIESESSEGSSSSSSLVNSLKSYESRSCSNQMKTDNFDPKVTSPT